jgi:ABC-type spermidine/putrescine transport system permease subunit II
MEQDLSLLIGLVVALVVFISVTLAAIRLIRSKARTSSIYNMASIGKVHLEGQCRQNCA